MKKVALRINTTRGTVTDLAGSPYSDIGVVNGDAVLFVVEFTEQLTVDETPLNLSESGAPLALRCTVDDGRQENATLLTFQDSYNQGHFTEYEVLSAGRVTWLVSFNTAALTAEIGTLDRTSVFLEFTLLDADNLPQTLAQIPILVFAQVDNGAVGTPPPSEPAYMTAATALSTFVLGADYFDSVVISSDTTLVPVSGFKFLLIDTSVNPITITLPSAAADTKFSPIIVNVGTNTVTVSPHGSETINGASGPVTIVSRYAAMEFLSDGANYIVPDFVTA